MFPAENLLYLSPDSRTDLTDYRDDDIMILGALIGKETTNHTLTKAKQDGIRHARLPMRKVLGFTSSLNIDACVPILNDFRNTKDWFYSFRWIPPRYIMAWEGAKEIHGIIQSYWRSYLYRVSQIGRSMVA